MKRDVVSTGEAQHDHRASTAAGDAAVRTIPSADRLRASMLMSVLRIGATLVTGMTFFAGGVVLVLNGPPLVILLGCLAAVVGITYTSAGLALERDLQPIAAP